MNWFKKISQYEQYDSKYPKVSGIISGLSITDNIPNTSSISASLEDYETLSGIREVSIAEFGITHLNQLFYAANDIEKSKRLAEEIQHNQYIDPLIIVIDDEGPYILEGAHRFAALWLLKISTFPALIVLDTESINENDLTIEPDNNIIM